ncbi:NHL repeat-containing protein 2-like [Tachypleus tridentatus]|uniref:NHL repeat-containing protein 2-like n=1 Tax=Tachypleus tridentatus TaxID=6853 RepID=UPI003FD36EC3
MRGSIISSPVPVKLLRESLPVSPLLFPGKVCVDEVGKRIVIADSGHHRILILNREGVVEHVIGGKDPGYKDGNFHQARFRSPQGIVWKNPAIIYVADTENHLIREINVSLRVVTTIAGTGYQGTDKVGGKQNKEQPISSPWDLCLGRSIGSEIEDILFIAMAGIHQVWMLFLEDAKWLKGSCYQRGTCIRFAGNGEEENRNNSYPERAGFAQPSGITIAQQENLQCLFIADSESSTVRQIMLKDGAVKAVVGGEKDPKNLFSFGDEDGKGIEAKLQHPLGVSWCSFKQVLYVADSYNHKVKVITPSAKTCTTLVGTGKAGYNSKSRFNEAELNEPGGLCVTDKGETLLVADTNNHVIKAINLVDETVSEHPVLVVFDETDSFKHLKLKDNFTCTSSCLGDTAYIIHIPTVEMRQGGVMILMLDVNLAPGVSINDEAPNKWQLNISDSSKLTALQMNADINTPIQLSVPAESRTTYPVKVDVEVHLFLCKKELGVCYMKTILFKVVVVICKTGQLEASLNLKCFIE